MARYSRVSISPNKTKSQSRTNIPCLELKISSHKGTMVLARYNSKLGTTKSKWSQQTSTRRRSPFGLFEFHMIPFGLKNAGTTFQRSVGHVIRGLPGFAVYVDDLLVFGSTKEEHDNRLIRLFQRLTQYDLWLNRDKCQL